MRPTNDEMEALMKSFFAVCRSRGLKCTPQRVEIFRALLGARDHPGVDDLRKKLAPRLNRLSPDTIYRTLGLLEELGMIQRIHGAGERARFEILHRRHSHFVCIRCGRIVDIPHAPSDKTNNPPPVEAAGRVTSFQWVWRGICRVCESVGSAPLPAPGDVE